MKKLISMALVLFMLLALLPIGAAADDSSDGVVVIDGGVYVNIAVGKKYTSTGTRYAGAITHSDTDSDGNLLGKLTDGYVTYSGEANMAAHEGDDTEVVIDLEKITEIKAAKTDLWGGQWGIASPENATVEFYYSVDGEKYTLLGNTEREKEVGAWISCKYTAKSEKPVEARYVKVHYKGNGRFRWSSEIMVYGHGEVAEIEHDVTEIDGVKYIRDFGENTPLESVVLSFGGKNVSVTNAKGTEKTSGVIGTGDVIKAGDDTYTVVVRGDASGDGRVASADYISIRLAILKITKLSKAQELAADINGNGRIDPSDYITARLYILKHYLNLDGKVGVTMPKIDEYIGMTVKKSGSTITFTAADSQEKGYKVEITMFNTTWGTWNLGHFYVTDTANKKTVSMNNGYTDWEYVYRVGETPSSIAFCGGNHNNEKLLDIAFYDAKTGKQLEMKNNATENVNGVKIVEHTQIYFHNQPNKPFVNVTRNYLINGADVWLECDYDFTKDAYFNLSYTGMFCIPKENGNHIIYNNVDGTTKEFTTVTKGTLNSQGTYDTYSDYGNPATSVEMYGDANPDLRIHAEIYDAEIMADNFVSAEKTFFWDMSVGENKLYFSKFDSTKAHKVEKGTHWDTLVRWSFYKK